VNKVHYSSRSNEWATPQWLFDKLNERFGPFTLDAAATAGNAKCPLYFTAEDDGLSRDWSGHTVFLNPPYGRAIAKWVKKAHDESANGATVVCLIPARTDTSYWHDYIFGKADVLFLRGRIKFEGPDGSPNSAPFPSAVVVFRPEHHRAGRRHPCIMQMDDRAAAFYLVPGDPALRNL